MKHQKDTYDLANDCQGAIDQLFARKVYDLALRHITSNLHNSPHDLIIDLLREKSLYNRAMNALNELENPVKFPTK